MAVIDKDHNSVKNITCIDDVKDEIEVIKEFFLSYKPEGVVLNGVEDK